MSQTLTIIVSFITIAIIIATIFIWVTEYKKAYKKVVSTSKRYLYVQKLICTNSFFLLNSSYSNIIRFDSKAKLDRLNTYDYMVNLLLCDSNLLDLINKASANRLNKEELTSKLEHGPEYHKKDGKVSNLYLRIERNIVNKLEKELIPVIPSFNYRFEYISPSGRNHYWIDCSYELEDMLFFKSEAERVEKNKHTAKYQRSMMSSSLRYDVMKRDNFHCVLCGRSAEDGVKLHVDHIIPISRGGKTTIDNLRTLCSDCNMGKKDKFDPDGIN